MTEALRNIILAAADEQALVAAEVQLERAAPADAITAMLWQLLGHRLRAMQAPAEALHAYQRAVEIRRRTGPRYALVDSLLAEAQICERLGLIPDAISALSAAVAADSPVYQAAIGVLRWAAELHRRRGDEPAAARCEADASARHERQGRLLPLDTAGWSPPTWYREHSRLSLFAGWVRDCLYRRRARDLWIPATTLDLDPFMFRALGLAVVVSEVFPATVERLLAAERAPDIHEVVARALARDPARRLNDGPGSLRVIQHDPCEPFEVASFDAIFANELYERRLSPSERRAAARAFYAALRPGGVLFVAPLHADSVLDRFELERPLVDAGFTLPLLAGQRVAPDARRVFLNYGN